MQDQIINMSKRKFRIGDLAQELKIKKYIIRFWEKEFDLKSDRSDGGQRFYTEDDLALFTKIKQLLYLEGYTIAGARKQLGISDGDGLQTENMLKTPFFDMVSCATETKMDTENATEMIIGACVEAGPTEKELQFKQELSEFKKILLQVKESIDKL